MSLITDINKIIEKLTSLYLFKGIQPSEIADAIFENQYSSIKLDRTGKEVILIATFSEFDESTEYKHQMKYVYSNNKCLKMIEQRVGNRAFKVQWSRQEEIDGLLNEFVTRIYPFLSEVQLNRVLSTLPKGIKPQVKARLKLVA